MATVANLVPSTPYFFAATAYNSAGLESLPCPEIIVVSGNNAPVVSSLASLTINQDSSTGALAFTVGDSETAAGSLTATGSLCNPALVPQANIAFGGSRASRTVTVTPAAQQYGTAVITLSVSDGSATTVRSFLLTVNAVNDAPLVSTVASLTINEDSPTGALAFTVGDPETAAGSLTATGSSSNPALVPQTNIAIGGSGASRTVTVTPAAQQYGTAVITLSVSDGTATTSSNFLLTVSASVSPALWEIVALAGDLAPGASGSHFSFFVSGVRSDGLGDAAFRATLDSTSDSTGGVWAESNGLLELIARQGGEAPGVTGGRFGAFEASPWWSGTGHLLLHAKLLTGSGGVTLSNDGGLWLKSPSGPLHLVVRENGQASGLPAGARLQQLGSNAVLGGDGRYTFTAILKTNKSLGISNENNSGLWTNFQGLPSLLAREGTAARGTRNGESFDTLTSALISANSSGQTAFLTLLQQTPAVTTANRSGIWMWDGAQLALIALGGDWAPGTPAGGVTGSNDTGIWVLENGAMALLAREGSTAPGAPSGAVYHALPARLAGNDAGDLFFTAVLRDGNGVDTSNDGGLWARSPATGNARTLIARQGFPATQTATEALFASFGTALVSGGGREVFTANLLVGQGGVTVANDRGLWMRAATGGINLVLREGDRVAVSPTDLRTVADFTLDGSSETSAASFSSGDSIKILAAFTDGSSAILSGDAP